MATQKKPLLRTRNEARKLIKKNTCIRYPSTVKDVLLNLLDGTYHPHHDSAEGRKVTRRLNTLMKGVRVELRQFENILKRLRDDDILKYSRRDGNMTYELDLGPIEALEGIDGQELKKRRNADRAARAREQRALNRERHRLADVQRFFRDLAETNRIRAAEFNALRRAAGQH